MFDPYGALLYTLMSDWLLHISSECCCTPGVYKICRTLYHLHVHVTLANLADCHKNIGPDPTMSYYQVIDFFHNAA